MIKELIIILAIGLTTSAGTPKPLAPITAKEQSRVAWAKEMDKGSNPWNMGFTAKGKDHSTLYILTPQATQEMVNTLDIYYKGDNFRFSGLNFCQRVYRTARQNGFTSIEVTDGYGFKKIIKIKAL